MPTVSGSAALVAALVKLAQCVFTYQAYLVLTKLFGNVQDEDSHESLHQLLKHGLGRATVAAELLCLCGMAPFLYIEASTFLEYGFYGWRSIWNLMDIVAYVNQVCAPERQHSMRLQLHGAVTWVFRVTQHDRHL